MRRTLVLSLAVLLGFGLTLVVFQLVLASRLQEEVASTIVAMGATVLVAGVALWGSVWIGFRLFTMKKEDVMSRAFLVGGIIVAVVFFVPGALTAWAMWNSPDALYFIKWKADLDPASTTFVQALTSGYLIVVSSVLAQIIVNNARSAERTGRVLFALGGSLLKKRADAYHLNNFLEYPDEEHNQYYFWLFVLKARMVIEELYRLGETNKRDILLDVVVTQLQEARRHANGKPTKEVVTTALELAVRFVNGEQLPRDETPKVLRILMLEMQQATGSDQQLREVAAGAREPTELFSRGSAGEKTT